METTKYWQQNAVYQIYPRSFADANGDGIGDLKGIISKLDYLKDLGVGIVWLSPVYASPNDDMGYDVSDYLAINPEYGTMKDMEKLIEEAKKRGIRIVMDLVVNHTSDEHKWFIESKKEGSPYCSYYYWRRGRKNNVLPPNNWTAMFPGPAWEFVPEVGLWYLHLYGKKQPDLDWHNPKVYEEVVAILKFWLDKGIYGFRCDVINQIWKESLENGKGHGQSARGIEHYLMKEGNHDILRRLQKDVFSHYDAVVIGETYNVDYPNGKRFLDGEMDMFFQFDHMGLDKPATPFFPKHFSVKKFMDIIYGWQLNCSWNANYLENHDQLRSISRFGDEKRRWKESGKMLATLNLTLRGTPFIYEGEEIGMLNLPKEEPSQYKDVCCLNINDILKRFHLSKRAAVNFIDHYNRDHARSPMQWDMSRNAGFSSTSGPTWISTNPNYHRINVEVEKDDSDSILSFYKNLLELRKGSKALTIGSFVPLKARSPVYAYRRDFGSEKVLIVINFSKKSSPLPKLLKTHGGSVLLSNYGVRSLSSLARLRPFEALILDVK